MLRLTLETSSSKRPGLRAEGRLIGDWAGLLEIECVRLLTEAAEIDLDLGGVTDVDARGLSALRGLRNKPVTLTGCTPIMLALLTEGSAA